MSRQRCLAAITVTFCAGCGETVSEDIAPSSPSAAPEAPGTTALAPSNEPEELPSECLEWLVDDFEGNAQLGAVWVHRVEPETDDLVVAEVVPDPLGAEGSAQVLHLALDFEQPASVDLFTHFHGIDPRGSDALRFKARTDSLMSTSTSLAVAITLGDWPPPGTLRTWTTSTVTLNPDWQDFTLPVSDLVGIDEALTLESVVAFHFIVLDTESVDIWLDEVALVCDE